jgi:hypothetical protein
VQRLHEALRDERVEDAEEPPLREAEAALEVALRGATPVPALADGQPEEVQVRRLLERVERLGGAVEGLERQGCVRGPHAHGAEELSCERHAAHLAGREGLGRRAFRVERPRGERRAAPDAAIVRRLPRHAHARLRPTTPRLERSRAISPVKFPAVQMRRRRRPGGSG